MIPMHFLFVVGIGMGIPGGFSGLECVFCKNPG